MTDHPPNEEQRVSLAVRSYIEARGLSREQFAYKVGLSKSTIDHLLTGKFSNKAIEKIEAKLGERFRSHRIIAKAAAEEFGGYALDEALPYVGDYYFIRRSFQDAAVIHAYAMHVEWSDELACLRVTHKGISETTFKQWGAISMPRSTNHILIRSGGEGWHQLCILTRIDFTRTLRGGLLALGNVEAATYSPVVAPVALVAYGGHEPFSTRALRADDAGHAAFSKILDEVKSGGYVRFI